MLETDNKPFVDVPGSLRRRPLAVFASFSGAGGVERMLIHLLRGFVALGEQVDLLLVRADGPHLADLPVGIRRIDLRTPHTLWAISELARYLRAHRPRALLAIKDRAGQAAVLARSLSGVQVPIALRLGTNLSASLAGRSPIARWLRLQPIRWLYPDIERIVTVSRGVAEDTARLVRLEPARIQVIRNPVITPALHALAAGPCPHPWLEPGQPPVILGAGRLQAQKDFPTLIRAFAQVRRARDCRLMILGEGGGRKALESLIAKLGLGDVVTLVGFRPDLPAYLVRAALFVLSSRWEGSPNVLTEALALGVPAVSTDCPSGPAEILANGRYGPLVPIGDANALAEAMGQTLDRPLPAAVLRAAVAEYDWLESTRAYLEVLDRLAASSILSRRHADH
ncbi:glycosyltransferase [Caldichromatium japonicum]|uniref:Glycosyltransferase n=1 Tax=Caldichromatium japonicum TaxID=2699430 RepID=A0A6G7VFE1_9GAMM|nr:glycosyltransferase [Caldichromatium japonicum]QIK38595.1 glycosyltransferase [Caldichromatium japonicum]